VGGVLASSADGDHAVVEQGESSDSAAYNAPGAAVARSPAFYWSCGVRLAIR
jgi:hypothetical protein